ncbi:hypothetical protein [Kocuria sp.]|uniref:hypothetical protein n=1 Tax=Kocuria sp. TaxID=1871328 RepID=UPI0026DC7AB5|nr:hypothetical protein [Kocuria sp.]MDO4918980.1 hypothetical protein [Kocuria sp.]
MTGSRTALFAISAVWLAVLLTVVLSLLLGKVLVVLAVFTGTTALVVTCFWAVRLRRDPQLH